MRLIKTINITYIFCSFSAFGDLEGKSVLYWVNGIKSKGLFSCAAWSSRQRSEASSLISLCANTKSRHKENKSIFFKCMIYFPFVLSQTCARGVLLLW